MNKSFGIYTDSLDGNIEIINEIASICRSSGDVVLFTDSIDSSNFYHYALFPSFYVKFFQGSVVFLNIEDYLEFRKNIIGVSLLYIKDSLPKNIDRSMLTSKDIFSKDTI